MFVRRSIPTLLVHGLIVAVALVGCKKQPTEQPDGAQPDAKPSEPAAETPEQGCKRMLERFGADIIEVELESCVSALTDGTELGVCREAGADVEKDYRQCFDQCMGSVQIDAATYSPGDSSTSPVANCVGGCFSNTCQ